VAKKPKLLAVAGTTLLALAAGLPRMLPVSDTLQGLLYGIAIGLLLSAALRSRMPEGCDTGTPALRRRYLREFMPAMLGYVVALFLSLWLLKQVEAPWLRAIVAMMPLPPIVLAMRAIVRYIRDADELQRRIELEAVSIATAFVSLAYLSGGFLQLAHVIQVDAGLAMLWMFPFVCFLYGVAKVAVTRRYW
jgi:hypothetical protein